MPDTLYPNGQILAVTIIDSDPLVPLDVLYPNGQIMAVKVFGGGGGGGSINGTIAANQVAFGTAPDTIGGSNDFTFDDTTNLASFTIGSGLSFAGTGSPTTVIGGDDSVGDSAILFDNADNYIVLRFQQFTDIFSDDWLELWAGGAGAAGGKISLEDTGNVNIYAGLTGGLISMPAAGHNVTVYPTNTNLFSRWSLQTAIPAGNTDYAQTSVHVVSQADATTKYWNSQIFYDAVAATGGLAGATYELSAEGNRADNGTFTVYRHYLWDNINSRGIYHIDNSAATTFIFDDGINLLVAGGLISSNGTEGADGKIHIAADQGDDPTDTWELNVAAVGNAFSFINNSNTLFSISTAGALTITGSLLPSISDGAALGSTSKQWSDLFLAEGGVINWDNGDATITQTGNDITIAGITTFGVGTSTAVTLGTIEIGDVSDTTIARVSAGKISVEGVNVVTISSTDTLTNKRITKRVTTAADATSITPNSDSADVTYQSNTQAAGTLTINADGGTPTNGQSWLLKIKSTNVQTFSWNAVYIGGTIALPTVSSGSSKIDNYAFLYDTVKGAWEFTGSATGFASS